MHCVWAVKDRRPLIKPDLQQRLWPYLGGIARENKMIALGRRPCSRPPLDPVHALRGEIRPAPQRQFSKWIHDTFKEHWSFEWQEGYGAFSIGISGVEDTTKYSQGQPEHHRKMSFKDGLEVFLKKHAMEFVEQDLE